QLFMLTWFSLDISLYVLGYGIVDYVPDQSVFMPLGFAGGIMWIWGLNMIRVSMGFLLLRLKDSMRWRWPLWTLISIQALLALAATAMQLARCWPISSAWKPTSNLKCIDNSSFKIYGYVFSTINIASDLVLALMPFTFIWGMHRSWLEKVLLCCLMAAGLMATGASIVRVVIILPAIARWSTWLAVVNDILWGLELTIGVIAASLPCLKAPAHEILRRLGIFRPMNAADASPESFLGHMSHGSHIMLQMNDIDLHGLGKEHATPPSNNQTGSFGAPSHALEAVESRNTDATSLGGNSVMKKSFKDFV
ncbi:hypothetical protein BKA66DRAFT_433020, partial [Pyrenochaeta sp. MPI-SDFR-AT-0127]